MSTELNPRWVAYAARHGRTPDEQLMYDERKYPGGCMCGRILWIQNQKRKFFAKHPEAFIGPHIGDQRAWDKWLGVL